MRRIVLPLAVLFATVAATASAQMPSDSTHSMKRLGTPDSLTKRVNLKVKVDANVASSAKVSADAAAATAISQVPEGGSVNSGELHMEDGKLVYDVNVVPNGTKTARMVRVDAIYRRCYRIGQIADHRTAVESLKHRRPADLFISHS